MFRKAPLYILIVLFSASLYSCSKYSKISKSQDFKYKYEKAMEYYENEDYYHALNLFDQIIPLYRGTDEAEDIAFKYSYAYYYQKDFVLASYYFSRFAKTFPRSEKAEEASFLTAYCKYLESPRYTLDQTNTYDAINGLQLFINAYPQSSRLEECNSLIDELRAKLQKKDFEMAKLYLKMRKYKAAVSSFENLLEDYPDTDVKEDALFYMIRPIYPL